MNSISIEEAQTKLPELIRQLPPGEELVITQDRIPIARLLSEQQTKRKSRRAGSAKGMLSILSDDDEHLEDFAGYME